MVRRDAERLEDGAQREQARLEPLVVEAVAAELRRAAEHRNAVRALAERLEHEVLPDAADARGEHAHAVALAAAAAAVEALQGVVRRPLAREDDDAQTPLITL
jgi:hypothetical protein